jgi:hypothetical protein
LGVAQCCRKPGKKIKNYKSKCKIVEPLRGDKINRKRWPNWRMQQQSRILQD